MDIITSIAAGLESVKVASDIVKWFKTFKDTLKDQEFHGKLLELNESILQIKENLLEAKQENLELQEKVMQLEQKLIDKTEFIYNPNLQVYWKSGDKDSPFCPKCFDKDSKKIRMAIYDAHQYFCKVCNCYSGNSKNPISDF